MSVKEKGTGPKSCVAPDLRAGTSFPRLPQCKPPSLATCPGSRLTILRLPAAKTASLPRPHFKVRPTPAIKPSSVSTRPPALLRHREGNRRIRDIRLLHLEGTSCLEFSEWLEAPTGYQKNCVDNHAPTDPRPPESGSAWTGQRI